MINLAQFRSVVLVLIPLLVQCGRSDEIYLSCSLQTQAGAPSTYTFTFNPSKGTLLWVEPSQPLSVTKNTESELWAEHSAKYRDFAYDQTDFRLNRVTGEGRISYLKKPTPEEIARCNKERTWGCEDFLVLVAHDEAGACKVVQRAVK